MEEINRPSRSLHLGKKKKKKKAIHSPHTPKKIATRSHLPQNL
jgi:hypothetical protein